MKKAAILLVVMATLAMAFSAGMNLGLGTTVVSESQSVADYGWTGTVGSTLRISGVDFHTRLLGTVYYPEHSHHAAMTGTVLGSIGVPLDDEFAIEVGGGIQFGNEDARTEVDEDALPVVFLGYDFTLASGHHVEPFAMWTLEGERKTVQAGFLITFGK